MTRGIQGKPTAWSAPLPRIAQRHGGNSNNNTTSTSTNNNNDDNKTGANGKQSFSSGKEDVNEGDGNANPYLLLLGAIKHVTAYSLENWVDDTGGPKNGTE